jgi:hypothetical protein
MIASTTNNQTADVLAGMFTENTGRHMLDSGNAYGRAWERNAGMTTADFLSRPAVQYDAEFQCVEVDLFHYLNERLTFEPELTKGWADFDAERPNDSWGETLDEWLDALGVAPEGGDFYSGARWGFNTYNFDNRLNGTIQGVVFGIGSESYVALQVHGGCDVRGGYTAFKIFSGDIESLLIDVNRATLHCPECEFYACFEGDTLEDYNLPKSYPTPDMLFEVVAETQLPEGWSPSEGCPLHKCALV